MPSARDLIALVVGTVALFWAVVWLLYAPWLGIAWSLAWVVILILDYQTHCETAPSPPVVTPEVDSEAANALSLPPARR